MLLDVEQHLPVKALFPFAGFWREHQGPRAPPDASSALLRFTHSCWSTDVLVHGSHNFAGALKGAQGRAVGRISLRNTAENVHTYGTAHERQGRG